MSTQDIKLNRVSFVRPAGNDTAIVWDQINQENYAYVANQIQQNFSNIEQVMFVKRDSTSGLISGQMAGGEFCANATRSLGYLLMNGSDGEIILNVSGTRSPIKANIINGEISIEIPLGLSAQELISTNEKQVTSVNFEGIVHIICRDSDPLSIKINSFTSIEQREKFIRQILQSEDYKNYPACGLMLLSNADDMAVKINPYVYVRNTGTLYNESACASGSAAVAVIESYSKKRSINSFDILQPSNLFIKTSVNYNNDVFENVSVGGEIRILYDGELILPRTRTILNAV